MTTARSLKGEIKMDYIITKGNEKISITCAGCGHSIDNWENIFEGSETSYICPECEYEGFANAKNTKVK